MVTALAQLHQHVEQPHLAGLPGSIHYVNILEQNLCIPEGVGGWGGGEGRKRGGIMVYLIRFILFCSPPPPPKTTSSPFPLHFGEAHVDLDLFLRRQFLLHVGLEATEEERSEYTVQSRHQLGVL